MDKDLSSVVASNERFQVELFEFRQLRADRPPGLDRLEPVLVNVAVGHACKVNNLIVLLDLHVDVIAVPEGVRPKIGLLLIELVSVVEYTHAHNLKVSRYVSNHFRIELVFAQVAFGVAQRVVLLRVDDLIERGEEVGDGQGQLSLRLELNVGAVDDIPGQLALAVGEIGAVLAAVVTGEELVGGEDRLDAGGGLVGVALLTTELGLGVVVAVLDVELVEEAVLVFGQ